MLKQTKKQNEKKSPIISVITAVYNCETLMGKCIDSVLNQTYENFEFILIDDGSTDATGSICEEYQKKDERIKVVHKVNEGQGVARNVGLDKCTGDYIAFLDGDDTFLPNMLETMMEYIVAEKADTCICGILLDNGLQIQKAQPYTAVTVFDNGELMKEYVATNRIHRGPCNKLYRRFLFDGVRFPALRAHEDAYIMHRLMGNAQKAICIPDCLYKQYIRFGSTETAPFSNKKLAALDCADSIMTYYKAKYPQLYSYVAFYKADSILDLLQQILCSYSYRRNIALYKRLFLQMKEEYKKVSVDYKRQEKTDNTQKAVMHPHWFKVKMYGKAIDRSIRNTVKRVLLKRRRL